MNKGTLFWMLILGISATSFFVIAATVSIKGFGDLLLLLQKRK